MILEVFLAPSFEDVTTTSSETYGKIQVDRSDQEIAV